MKKFMMTEPGIRESKYQDRIFTIPNLMGLYRIVLSPIIAWLLIQQNKKLALILLVTAFLTDLFDGYLARKLNQTSKLGAVLDPIADKLLFIFVIFATLTRDGLYNWIWFLGIYTFIITILYLLVHMQFLDLGMRVNYLGKGCVFINCFVLFFLAAGYTNSALLISFTILILIPQFLYFYVFYQRKQEHKLAKKPESKVIY